MTSLSPPVIEFPVDDSTATSKQLVLALENYGCFVAKYDKLSQCQEKLFSALKMIFDLPLDTKNRNVSDIPDFSHGGNLPVLLPRYESFGIREATSGKDIQNFITTMWPGGNDDTCNAILAYTETAAELEKMVRKIVFDYYRIQDGFQTGYIFRMMKHGDEVRMGCSDRTNRMEFLAVLDLNQAHGSKMKTKDGKPFNIVARPSTFLIMAGVPLKEWSQDKIYHQDNGVTMSGNQEKYSDGLFSYYDKGNTEAPKEQVGSSSR